MTILGIEQMASQRTLVLLVGGTLVERIMLQALCLAVGLVRSARVLSTVHYLLCLEAKSVQTCANMLRWNKKLQIPSQSKFLTKRFRCLLRSDLAKLRLISRHFQPENVYWMFARHFKTKQIWQRNTKSYPKTCVKVFNSSSHHSLK